MLSKGLKRKSSPWRDPRTRPKAFRYSQMIIDIWTRDGGDLPWWMQYDKCEEKSADWGRNEPADIRFDMSDLSDLTDLTLVFVINQSREEKDRKWTRGQTWVWSYETIIEDYFQPTGITVCTLD